ncbi:MAG: hypothetical protein WEA76_09215 [Acidimicrobiia bacterium]
MPVFDPTYVLDVIADRDQIEWFSPSAQTDGFLAGPADIYLRTSDDVVTWGWSVEPLPVDPGMRRFRRFRHPDGWAMLTDADDPETLFLAATTEIHAVVAPDGRIVHAVTADAGSAPGSGDAYSLQKAAEGDNEYRLEQAWPAAIVSAALELWCESFLNRTVAFSARPITADDADAVRALVGEADEPVGESDPLGHDAEVAELIEGFDDIFWFQADLTWPDRDDDEAFRDRIDVRIRDGAVDTWLLSIEPLDDTPGSLRLLEDGGKMVLDPDDPNLIRLGWDRLVLAVSVQETGFEPAGVAVPIGSAPGTEQWEELRRVAAEHPGSVVIHAPAWSETRVSHALTEWAEAWAGLSPRFVYDFDDPVSQEAIEANNFLEDAGPAARSVRTATRQLCGHTEEASAAHEEPLPCGLPATAYYRDGDVMVLVCDAHARGGVKLTTLLRA